MGRLVAAFVEIGPEAAGQFRLIHADEPERNDHAHPPAVQPLQILPGKPLRMTTVPTALPGEAKNLRHLFLRPGHTRLPAGPACGEDGPQHRGGMGMKNYNVTEKTGKVAACKVVDELDDILIISDDGTIIRMAVDGISVYSRATQGVRLMRVSEGSRVISVARTEHESEEDGEVPEGEEE